MRTSRRWMCAALLLTVFPLARTVSAGPNEYGLLLVHTDDAIVYTTLMNYAGLSGLVCAPDEDCPPYENERTCVDNQLLVNDTSGRAPGEGAVWWVLAGFPNATCPSVAVATFGIDWGPSDEAIVLAAWGSAGDLEVPQSEWPARGTGTAIVWDSPVRSQVFELYWFAGYAAAPGIFELTPHPLHAGTFADDQVPPQVDPIHETKMGLLGLGGATGWNPYHVHHDELTGTCCLTDGSCVQRHVRNCAVAGGRFVGDISCGSNACDEVPVLPMS